MVPGLEEGRVMELVMLVVRPGVVCGDSSVVAMLDVTRCAVAGLELAVVLVVCAVGVPVVAFVLLVRVGPGCVVAVVVVVARLLGQWL